MKSLSILIPSIESRRSMLSSLTCDLIQQCGVIKSITSFVQDGCTVLIIGFDGVEIIIAIDDQVISTGKKRQLLLELANNDYVCSIDEDDYVFPYYVDELKSAIQTELDCIEFDGVMTTDGKSEVPWMLRMGVQNTAIHKDGRMTYMRHINHLSAVKRDIALLVGYNDVSNGEDKYYSEGLREHLKTSFCINRCMYHYQFSTLNKTYK